MDFNLEAALAELDSFQTETSDLSPVLENYLQVIAKTGNILFPWNKLQPILKKKIELVLAEFAEASPPENITNFPNTDTFDFEALKASVLGALDGFPDAPFTIQRLCELIVYPRRYYSRTDKYMRGLEKNLLVVSTIDSISDGNTRNNSSVVNGSADFSTEASYEEAPDSAANGASMCTTPTNGTVLENFATVFPSANRMAAPSNSIQVPEISESNDFLDSECSVSFDYDIGDNVNVSDMESGDSQIMSDVATDSTTVSEDSENAEVVMKSPELVDGSTSSSVNDDFAESTSNSTNDNVSESTGSSTNEDISENTSSSTNEDIAESTSTSINEDITESTSNSANVSAVAESTSSSTNDEVENNIALSPLKPVDNESLPNQAPALESEPPVIRNVISAYTSEMVGEEKSNVFHVDSSSAQADTGEPSAKRIKLDNSVVDDDDDDNNDIVNEYEENKSPENAVGYDKEEIDDVAIRKINQHDQNGINNKENVDDDDEEAENEDIDDISVKVDNDNESSEKAENAKVDINEQDQEMTEVEVEKPKSSECAKEVFETVEKTLNDVPKVCSDS